MSPCKPFLRAAVLAALLFAASGCETSRVSAPRAPEPVPPVTPPGSAQGEAIFSLATTDSAVLAAVTIGIVRSVDGGLTWSLVHPPMPFALASIGDHVFATSYTSFAISDDAGLTWRDAPSAPMFIQRLAVSGSTLLAVGGFDGLYRSTDLGVRWERVTTTPAGSIQSIATEGSRVIIVADNRGFRSDDGGATWSTMSNPPETPVSIVPKGGRLYAGALLTHVFVSSDDGATWSRTAADPPAPDDGYDNYLVRLASIGTDLYALTLRGLFRTSDRGASWASVAVFPSHDFATEVLAHGESLYVGMDNSGVLRSDDQGASWLHTHATGGGPIVVTVTGRGAAGAPGLSAALPMRR